MKFLSKSILTLVMLITVVSCSLVSSQENIDAVILKHTPESLRELRLIVAEAVNQRPVTIAKTAFLKSNRLLLTIKKPIGPDGLPIQTRIDEKPIELQLFISGEKCFIRNQRTQLEFELTQANCRAKT